MQKYNLVFISNYSAYILSKSLQLYTPDSILYASKMRSEQFLLSAIIVRTGINHTSLNQPMHRHCTYLSYFVQDTRGISEKQNLSQKFNRYIPCANEKYSLHTQVGKNAVKLVSHRTAQTEGNYWNHLSHNHTLHNHQSTYVRH